MSVVVPALAAGLVAIAATRAVERWGGKTGGLLGSLPTTIVPAAWGMSAAGAESLERALSGVPPGMLANALFLLSWRYLPARLPDGPLPRRLATMTALSLTVWAAAAGAQWALGRTLEAHGVPTRLFAGGCAVVLGVLGIVVTRQPRPAPRGQQSVRWSHVLARGVLAAGAVVAGIAVQRAGGGVLAGMATVFPAIYLTAMVGLWLAQGEAVPAGAVGPLVLGSTGVALYALLAARLLPALGPGPGSLVAWLAAVICVDLPAVAWLRSRG